MSRGSGKDCESSERVCEAFEQVACAEHLFLCLLAPYPRPALRHDMYNS